MIMKEKLGRHPPTPHPEAVWENRNRHSYNHYFISQEGWVYLGEIFSLLLFFYLFSTTNK